MSLFRRALGAAAVALAAIPVLVGGADASTLVTGGQLTLTSTTPDSVPAGSPATITLTGANNAGVTVNNAYVNIVFPKTLGNVTAATSTVPGAVCGTENVRLSRTVASCFFGDLAPGATVSAQFTLVPNGSGDVYVDSGMFARLPSTVGIANDYVGPQVILVSPGPTDVQLGGSVSAAQPAPGATYRYTYQVKNLGPQPALGTSVAVTSPNGLLRSATTSTGAVCTVSATSVTCPVGTLAPSGQATVTVNAVAPTIAGSYAVTAAATVSNGDTRPTNNTSSLSIRVR